MMGSIALEEGIKEAKKHPKASKIGGILSTLSPFILLAGIVGGGFFLWKWIKGQSPLDFFKNIGGRTTHFFKNIGGGATHFFKNIGGGVKNIGGAWWNIVTGNVTGNGKDHKNYQYPEDWKGKEYGLAGQKSKRPDLEKQQEAMQEKVGYSYVPGGL